MTPQAAPFNTNSTLVSRCKKGDEKAYHELYRLHVKAMLNVSMRIVNNKDEAEDVLQESFIKAFRYIHTFNENVSFGAWLKRIVINRSIDFVRKRKYDFISLDEAEYVEEDQKEEKIEYNLETVKKGIEKLPDGYRVVLTLYLFEDLTHKEIAEVLGISEGTSKSQYNRAKKKLRDLILLKNNSHE